MNFDHAFIVTYGRSGSTLLQGLLNTIPGAEIRGENGNVLFFIHKIADAMKACKRHAPLAKDDTHPWFGAASIPHEQYVEDMVATFKRNVMPSAEGLQLTGFKEIRFQVPYEQLNGYIDFVRSVFPRSAIIFNTRKLDAVIESNRRAKHNVDERRLRDADANFRRIASDRPDHTYLIHYDDYVADPENLRGLFDFLGAPFDARAIKQTMGRTHSVRTSATNARTGAA